MKVMDLFLITLLSGALNVMAQRQPQATAGVDVGAGIKNNSWSPSVLYHEEIGSHNFRFLKAGFGFRAWGYYAGHTELNAQSESVSPDVLKYGRVSVNGLSFVAGVNLKVWRIDLGANTDLIGLVIGSQRNGFYSKITNTPGLGAAFYNTEVSTKPKAFNVIPFFQKKQTGQSELYARIWLSKMIGLKLGYLAGRVTYLTKKVEGKKIILDDGRSSFSATYGMPYVSLCFAIQD